MQVLGIAGSLRAGSFNRALLRAAVELAPPEMRIEPWERLGAIPHYNADLDTDERRPEVVRKFKERIGAADGLLFATPEYNYGVPGVLKNAIDWASRPAYKSVMVNKPAAIIGASGSAIGTARGQAQLREVLYGTLAQVMGHPGVLVGQAGQKFSDGELTDEATREFVAQFLRDFAAYVERFQRPPVG